jgi:hypothetical protein
MGQIVKQNLPISDVPTFETLSNANDPETLVTSKTWTYWRQELAESASQNILTIAENVDLFRAYVEKDEILSDYLDLDFSEILNRFGAGKKRSLFLCVAKAVTDLEKKSDSNDDDKLRHNSDTNTKQLLKRTASSKKQTTSVKEKIEKVVKKATTVLHYKEVEEQVFAKYGSRHATNGILNNSPNIIKVLPGVFVHKENFSGSFLKEFNVEKTSIIRLLKDKISQTTSPLSIYSFSNALNETGDFHRFSEKSIAGVISSARQIDPCFRIIPEPGNPKERSIIHKACCQEYHRMSENNSSGYNGEGNNSVRCFSPTNMSRDEASQIPTAPKINEKVTQVPIEELISQSGLSERSTHVIQDNVFDTTALFELTEQQLFNYKNCGRDTVREILDFVNRLKSSLQFYEQIVTPNDLACLPNVINFQVEIRQRFSKPPTEDCLSLLPLFSQKPYSFILEKDLHQKYKTELSIANLDISVRTGKVLKQMKISRIGQVLLTPVPTFLAEKNFGRKSLHELRGIIRQTVLAGKNDNTKKTDFSSFKAMVESVLANCKMPSRNQRVLALRILPEGRKQTTLQEIGVEFSLTRERIRQILKKGFRQLQHPRRRAMLEEFWEAIREIMAQGGGLIELEELAENLQEIFGWKDPINSIALKSLMLEVSPRDLIINKTKGLVKLDSCECLTCPVPSEVVSAVFSDPDNSQEINIWVLGKKILEECQIKCTIRVISAQHFHKPFLRKQIRKAKDICVLENDLVFPINQWTLRYGSDLGKVVLHVLKEHTLPLHFTEIADTVRKISERYKDISDTYVHNILIEMDEIQLAGRGTYGLSSWGLDNYRPASKAIEEMLVQNGIPIERSDILVRLMEEYTEGNIRAALEYPKFQRVYMGYYDLQVRWASQTFHDYIQMLPKPLSSFLQYVIPSEDVSSPKLVFALVLVKHADSISFEIMKARFLNFYLIRKKRGLIVEKKPILEKIEAALLSDEEASDVFAIEVCDFIQAGFLMEKNGEQFELSKEVSVCLEHKQTKTIATMAIIKQIEVYYTRGDMPYSQNLLDIDAGTMGTTAMIKEPLPVDCADSEAAVGKSISIKTKTKGRIAL